MEDKGLRRWHAELETHKEMRRNATRIRNIISKRQTSYSLVSNCKYLIDECQVSTSEIAEATDLSVTDIENLYRTGVVYPYVRSNWVRYLHTATDGNQL